jgi:heme-degrading monooxygenase HmoA
MPNGDPVVLINAFELPPEEAEERFLASWEPARDFLAAHPGFMDTSLHRSLAPDADFRFVNVAHWRSPAEFQAALAQPGFPGRGMPWPAHNALYQVIAEDAPGGDGEPPESVVLINLFEVPAGAEDEFERGWQGAREVMQGRPDYLWTRLHRSLAPDADFRYVNVAGWRNPESFRFAIEDPGFRKASAGIPGRPHPALYQVIHH